MNTQHSSRHSALLAASLALVASISAAASADDSALSRQTGVSAVIAAQGNDALQRIRLDLAAALKQQRALPVPAQAEADRDAQIVAARFNP
ncbi:MAG: hypothetical protein M3O62_03180 [Pseudomonadota bacterium]|nr:hypothetical protein [Pseudomonadota bacterium]